MKLNLNSSTISEPAGALTYFTQSPILRQIGHRRLAMLLKPFNEELKTARVVLPEPDPQNDDYFADLANTLAIADRLPGRLRQTLLTIELAALPENDTALWCAIKRRIPGVSVSQDCALDRALELWFTAPEEFAQFIRPPQPCNGSTLQSNLEEVEPRINTTRLSSPKPDEHGCRTKHADDGGTNDEASGDAPIGVVPFPCLAPESDKGRSVVFSPADSEALAHLARLPLVEYDRLRKAEAKRLGIRIETLDSEVARLRPPADDGQGRAVHLPPVEPWPEPVDGADVLDQVSARFTHQLVLPPGAADALALWAGHAHACPAFVHTPRLNLSSPGPGCGKTTTLDLIATMTPRPLRTENLTAPVLFRLVDQHQPTLLLDEVDSYLTQAEELRGLLNAGHKRGACAYRCEGEGNAVRAFKAFAPAVLSGIGDLPGTLRDRSILIVLLSAEPDQLESRFDSLHTEIETLLCRKLARWTQDHFPILQACNPTMPPSAFNRLADNWRPLFAIAQVAGGDWPRRALEAFNHLTADEDREEANATRLLADIRQILCQSGQDRISSTQLVDGLRNLPGGSWHSVLGPPGASSASAKSPRSAFNWLGCQLQRFGVKPRSMRVNGEFVKGYTLNDFAKCFADWLEA